MRQQKNLTKLLDCDDNGDSDIFENPNMGNSISEQFNERQQQLLQKNPSYFAQEEEGRRHFDTSENVKQHFQFLGAQSEQYSQNSMMISQRNDDQSRNYQNQKSYKNYRTIIEEKKREEARVNQVVEKQISSLLQQIQKKNLQIQKKQGIIDGLNAKVNQKDKTIAQLEEQIQNLKIDIENAEAAKDNLMSLNQKKEDLVVFCKSETMQSLKMYAEKDAEVNKLKEAVSSLETQLKRYSQNLSLYQESDRNLLDFKNIRPSSELTLKKTFSDNREVENLKKQKANLQTELTLLRLKAEEKESKLKYSDQDGKKKIIAKDKKIGDLEAKISQLKDQLAKMKINNDLQIDKLKQIVNQKNKQNNQKSEKIVQSDKRIKNLSQQIKKRDQKIKQLGFQVIEKNKIILEKNKQLQEMKQKSSFDHHMLKQTQQNVDKLLLEKKGLVQKIQSLQMKADKLQKLEKNEKNDKTKKDREYQKSKKEFDDLTLQYKKLYSQFQSMEKETHEKDLQIKDLKKKYEQSNKKMNQSKQKLMQIQSELQQRVNEFNESKQIIKKANKQISEYKKKIQTIPEMANKIIILQSRLKDFQQTEYRETQSCQNSFDNRGQVQVLENRLDEREREIKMLRSELKKNNRLLQIENLEEELEQKDMKMEQMQRQLVIQNQRVEKLQKQIAFKEHSLQYLHQVLLQAQRQKIEAEQQGKCLQSNDSYYQSYIQDVKPNYEEQSKFYQQKISSLENKIANLQKKLREKEEIVQRMNNPESRDQSKFQIRQLKKRIKELSELALSKDRKISPETLSQEQTVDFLVRTIKRVNKSSDMLRLLTRNSDFRESLNKMLERI